MGEENVDRVAAATATATQDFPGFMKLARDYMGELVCGSKQSRNRVLARMRAVAYDRGPRAKIAARQVAADVREWIRQSGPLMSRLCLRVLLRGFQTGLVGLAAMVALATFVVVFLSATANAMIISLILSISLVGFLMASFFTSLTAVYVGAMLAAGVTISSVTFFTICGMIMAAGWFTFSWGIWNLLRKMLQAVRNSAVIVCRSLSQQQQPQESNLENLKRE